MIKKKLLLVLFVLSLTAGSAFAQIEKANVNFYYSTKAGKSVDAQMVHFTFMITGIKSDAHYQALYNRFLKQDGIRKVDMSPYDIKQESALCKFSFKKPLTSEYLQKVLTYLGLDGVYIDNEFIAIANLSSYLDTKKKQNSTK
jgi:hypothetical protein